MAAQLYEIVVCVDDDGVESLELSTEDGKIDGHSVAFALRQAADAIVQMNSRTLH